MKPQQRYFGLGCSMLGHVLLAVVALLALNKNAAEAIRAPEVFTVTLEGGQSLGGIDSLPDPSSKAAAEKVPEAAAPQEAAPEPEPEPEAPVAKKASENPQIIAQKKKEKAAKLKAEKEKKKKAEAKKKKAKEEAKKKAEKKRKAAEEKERKEEKRKAAEQAKKKAEADKLAKKKREAAEKKNREKKFSDRIKSLRKKVDSKRTGADSQAESYNAGGRGMGAARLGGQGSGGGALTSVAKLAYMRSLENHVKKGWRWIASSETLSATVNFAIRSDGSIGNLKLLASSGNSTFDESVLRAVRKASPAPVPPAEFAADAQDVRIVFDSKN